MVKIMGAFVLNLVLQDLRNRDVKQCERTRTRMVAGTCLKHVCSGLLCTARRVSLFALFKRLSPTLRVLSWSCPVEPE